MALIAFDLPSSEREAIGPLAAPSHIIELLSPSQKLKTAGELNAAILASQSQGCDPKLPQMLRLMTYGEKLLGPTGPGKTAFPRLALAKALDEVTAKSNMVDPASVTKPSSEVIVAMPE